MTRPRAWLGGGEKGIIVIFVDPSERKTNLPHEHWSIPFEWADSLEALTGADIMVTLDNLAPTTMRKVRYHLDEGAFLIQVKIGLDIVSSVGQRLHNSLCRMKELGAMNPQSILLNVGIVTERDEIAYVDGRESIPARRGNYWSVTSAHDHWGDQGGIVRYLHRPAQIERWLRNKERDLRAYKTDFVKEAWPPKKTYPDDPGNILQVLVPVKDWRVTLRNAPKLGLGPKKLNALQGEMAQAGEPDTLLTALMWLVSEDKPKVAGIGKGIKQKVRDHLGLQPGQNLVATPHFPTTLVFPATAKVGVVSGQWTKLPDGHIEARYESQEQLALCIAAVGEQNPKVWKALGVNLDE